MKVVVFVNGRRVRVVRGRNIGRVTVGRLPRGKFRLKVVATESNGRRLVVRRSYRRCGRARPRR